MKRFLKILFSLTICFTFFNTAITFAKENEPIVDAEGMVLIDATTGTILAEKNSDKKLAPASTTKVMTALLVLENTKLNDIVTVGKNPPFADGSSIALKENDQYTVEELLHALLLESSNDSAMALAEHISGSEENFAKLMNKRAKELGATNTNFVNASGLYDDNHYTTATDLSLIMREAIKNKDYLRISKTITYELPESKVDGATKWVNNTTSMINPNSSSYYEHLIATKTGYTELAKCSFVAAAKKGNQTLISVLLKSELKANNFTDTKSLMDYGFDNYGLVKIINKGDEVSSIAVNNDTKVPLLASDDVYYLAENDSTSFSRSKTISTDNNISTNIKLENKDLNNITLKKGEEVLNSEILVNNKTIIHLPLLSGVDVSPSPLKKSINFIKANILIILAALVLLLIIIFIIRDRLFRMRYRRRYKKIIFKSKNRRNKLRW